MELSKRLDWYKIWEDLSTGLKGFRYHSLIHIHLFSFIYSLFCFLFPYLPFSF